MTDTPRSRSSRRQRIDVSGRSVRRSPLSDSPPRSLRRRRRRSVAGPLAVVALLVISLVVAVPAGISWARGRKAAAPQAKTPAPAAVPAPQVASAPAGSAAKPPEPAQVASASPSSAAQPESPPAEDTSWQEKYKGKLVLGFKPEAGYKAVALTFDDGPNGQTKYVLKTLAEYNGQGTFFDSGRKLAPKWAATQAPMIEKAGSEIANHTQSHTVNDVGSLWRRTYDFCVKEITQADTYVMKTVGHNMLWVRPMGGMIDSNGVKAAADTGHLVINWTIDSNDSHGGPRTSDYIYRQCTENVKSGDVILLHVTKQESMDALPRICAELDRRGLKMVTVTELAKHSTPITAKIPK
jgi:peptidoglycan/xylan/chitin deacetylase (PgdA/CDA1 family)